MLFTLKQSNHINQSYKKGRWALLNYKLKHFHENIKVSLTNNTTYNMHFISFKESNTNHSITKQYQIWRCWHKKHIYLQNLRGKSVRGVLGLHK